MGASEPRTPHQPLTTKGFVGGMADGTIVIFVPSPFKRHLTGKNPGEVRHWLIESLVR